jgi:hypothetical protein
MKNSYIINKTYENNELQYYILYVHVHYHFITTLLYVTVDLH